MIPKIHPLFKLNGRSLDYQGVMTVAYSYVKEGEPWEREIGDFLLNWLDDFEVMTVYTSGSTGTPKQFKLQKEHMINSAQMTGDYFDLPAGTLALCCLPLSYIAGKMMLVRAMLLGWEIDVVKPKAKPLKKAEKRYDFTAMTPYQVSNSLKHIHKTRKLLIGGAAVSDELVKSLTGKHTRAFHSYGMTETTSHIAVRELYPNYQSSYQAVAGVSLDLDDRGCLVINAPDYTSDVLVTNDLVTLQSPTSFTIEGRIDNVINSGGVKIFPSKVEQKLAVGIKNRFFVTAMPSKEFGEEVTLFIEGDKQDESKLFKNLEAFERPKKVYYLKSFVLTHTGKIDKNNTIEMVTMQLEES